MHGFRARDARSIAGGNARAMRGLSRAEIHRWWHFIPA